MDRIASINSKVPIESNRDDYGFIRPSRIVDNGQVAHDFNGKNAAKLPKLIAEEIVNKNENQSTHFGSARNTGLGLHNVDQIKESSVPSEAIQEESPTKQDEISENAKYNIPPMKNHVEYFLESN